MSKLPLDAVLCQVPGLLFKFFDFTVSSFTDKSSLDLVLDLGLIVTCLFLSFEVVYALGIIYLSVEN